MLQIAPVINLTLIFGDFSHTLEYKYRIKKSALVSLTRPQIRLILIAEIIHLLVRVGESAQPYRPESVPSP